jgi:hypothetical protein
MPQRLIWNRPQSRRRSLTGSSSSCWWPSASRRRSRGFSSCSRRGASPASWTRRINCATSSASARHGAMGWASAARSGRFPLAAPALKG